MPAIQPARLKIQAAQLAVLIDQPEAFVRELHRLLDFYADRTYRPGESGQRTILVQTYIVPAPVLRQITHEVLSAADQHAEHGSPSATLALSQVLWDQPYLEFRHLAAVLVGALRPAPPAPVLARLDQWIQSAPEEYILLLVLEHATVRLRREAAAAYLGLIETWLHATDRRLRQAGLRALQVLADDQEFADLPALFRLFSPWVRATPGELRPEVLTTLIRLCQRSPSETALFLRENLETPEHPDTPWLIRQVLGEFPPAQQAGLRTALRA
jgi:hypothetical protein